MEIIRLSEAKTDYKAEMGRVFAEGFYQWLRFFSKDKEKLSKAFSHMFNPNNFFLAISKDSVMGIAACAKEGIPSVKLNKKEIKKHLGFIMGTMAYHILKKEFEKKRYPFLITEKMAAIEFVAVDVKCRRQGVAQGLIEYIIERTAHDSYVLEVADTNTGAIALYEKLGFKEFLRIKLKHVKTSGVNFLVYMKHE